MAMDLKESPWPRAFVRSREALKNTDQLSTCRSAVVPNFAQRAHLSGVVFRLTQRISSGRDKRIGDGKRTDL